MNAGYSGTPLAKKLGIKSGMIVALMNVPDGYEMLLGGWPEGVIAHKSLESGHSFNFIHYFAREKSALERDFPDLKTTLAKDGMLWVSWPKKAAKVQTDITEDVVRNIALAHGLVDVKVAAVDAVWSGLKIVYRVKDR